jgi:hypothetical protein
MANYIRVCSALAGAVLLAACASRTADVRPNANVSATAEPNPACLSQTASRIAGTAAHCAEFGRTYSGEDISRTGATSAGEALRLLDPSVTLHSH